MSRKPKFKPEITRVKLNPEQAVLTCDCWSANEKYSDGLGSNLMRISAGAGLCVAGAREDYKVQRTSGGRYGPEGDVASS